MLAQNLVDADSNNTFSGDQTFDGDNTFNGTNEFNDATTFNADVTVTGATTGIDTSGAKAGFILPNLTTVQRLALPLTNGTHVYDTDL